MSAHVARWCLVGLTVCVACPTRAEGGVHRPLLLAVRGGEIFPLGWGGPEPAPLGEALRQPAIDALLRGYLAPGRRYRFTGEGGTGTATVTTQGHCEAEFESCGRMTAGVRVAVGGRPRADARGLASDGPLGSVAPASRRPLDDADRRALAAHAAAALRRDHPWQAGAGQPADAWAAALRAPKVTGHAQDLDGDGRLERIGFVQFGGGDGVLQSIALLLREAPGGRLELEDQRSYPGAVLDELGTADVNGDRADDVVFASTFDEWWSYDVWLSGPGGRRVVTIGGDGI